MPQMDFLGNAAANEEGLFGNDSAEQSTGANIIKKGGQQNKR